MAACYRIFGFSYWAGRLPAVFFSASGIAIIYKSLAFYNIKPIAKYAAVLLLATNFYMISITSGRQFIDQNDAVLLGLFFNACGLLLWWFARPSRSVMLIFCCFVAAAVLTKWVVGLLFFGVFSIWVVFSIRQHYKHWLLCLVVLIGLVLPWQWYAAIKFPKFYWHEFHLSAQHFTQVLEGQRREWYYFFNLFPVHFSYLFLPLLVMGFVFLAQKHKQIFVSMLLALLGIYTFFTLAATKMPSFTFISFPIVVVIGVFGLHYLLVFKSVVVRTSAVVYAVLLLFFNAKSEQVYSIWSNPNSDNYARGMIKNITAYNNFKLGAKDILFNMPGRTYIDYMLYSKATAYYFRPHDSDILHCKNQGYNLHMFIDTTIRPYPVLPQGVHGVYGKLEVFE